MDHSLFFWIVFVTFINANSGVAQQVHHLNVDQAFNCCPSHYYRSDPVIYCYKGREKNVIHLWETVQLHLNLASDEFEQFDGYSPEDVQNKFESRKASWYFNIYTTKKKVIRLNPFNNTCVGIVSKNDYAVKLTRIRVDYWKVLITVAGLVLFFAAPKLSSNSLFYYLCGISFGTCASLLILVFIISRFLPKKPMMYSFLVGGWTIGLYLVQFLFDNIRTIAMEYQQYVVYYIVFTAVISFMICYRLGPVSDPRSINLIKWLMQAAGLLMILFSSDIREITLAFDIILLVACVIPFRFFFSFLTCWTKLFRGKPVRRLLTEDEFHEESIRETAKALDELRGYCSSPECNQWKTVIKLRDPLSQIDLEEMSSFRKRFLEFTSPLNDSERKELARLRKKYVEFMYLKDVFRNNDFIRASKKINNCRCTKRFARFVEGGSHLDDEEVLAFESDMKDYDDELLTDDSSSEES